MTSTYGEDVHWEPQVPRLRLVRTLVAWVVSAVAVWVAAAILPGLTLGPAGSAFLVAALIAVLNAILPPMLAALRLPFMLAAGFILLLIGDALLLVAADEILSNEFHVDSFGDALLASLLISAVTIVLQVIARHQRRRRVLDARDAACRQAPGRRRSARMSRGSSTSRSTGSRCRCCATRCATAARRTMARWIAEDGYHLTGWETDLSSQTGASQAGILLGSNEDIPAFRWVEKEHGRMMVCSSPADCAEIERRHSTGNGLLADGGASRGNLLSGEADETILTASRTEAEKRANPGYRAFFANGFNVSRALVLFFWEIALEMTASARAKRRDVLPRGHRGGIYPLMRGAMCVIVRDLVVYGVLTDMMRGRPAVYATFASYDEVAHHSGLMRADTLEALRKLDQQFGRIARARRYAPRPYEIVVLSDHGQTQGATFKQRNGYGLEELVERSLSDARRRGLHRRRRAGGDGRHRRRRGERPRRKKKKRPGNDVSDRDVVVLGSGNLGLVYLMESKERLTLEQIEQRHPKLIPALREHPHVGWLLVASERDGALVLGPRGTRYLEQERVEGEDPLEHFSPTAWKHLLRTHGFPHVADIMVGSFYDPVLDEGCAFEELISFHGGLGGPRPRPSSCPRRRCRCPSEPLLGAAAVHGAAARLAPRPGEGGALRAADTAAAPRTAEPPRADARRSVRDPSEDVGVRPDAAALAAVECVDPRDLLGLSSKSNRSRFSRMRAGRRPTSGRRRNRAGRASAARPAPLCGPSRRRSPRAPVAERPAPARAATRPRSRCRARGRSRRRPRLEVRVQLDLVDRRDDLALGGEPLEMSDLEVRDADRARGPGAPELLERTPRRHEVAVVERRQRPVDQEQVDVVHRERVERSAIAARASSGR